MAKEAPGRARRSRLASLGAASLTAASALLLLGTVAQASAAQLKPDLFALDKGPVRLCQEAPNPVGTRNACHGTGLTVLRTSTFLGNEGAGPLELAPVPPGQDIPEDCHGDGDVDVNGDGIPDDNDVWVVQRTFNDVNGDGVFERSIDKTYTSQIVGCRYFHAIHNHYHLDGYAQLQLRSDATGQIVRTGDKISFCIADSQRFDPTLPGSPSSLFYGEAGCSSRLSVQGTSVGWDDLYGWALPGQQIDITGVPAGNYCFIVRTDPNNMIQETNETNNDRHYHVFIDPSRAPVNSFLGLNRLKTPCP